MSLLSEAMENCIYINRAKVSDGYGGYMDVFRKMLKNKL